VSRRGDGDGRSAADVPGPDRGLIPSLPAYDEAWEIEGAFRSVVTHLLKQAKVLHWDTSDLAGGRYGYTQTGAPDIMAIGKDGRFVAIELKSAKGKLSPHQKARRNQILAAGGKYVTCRTVAEVFEAVLG